MYDLLFGSDDYQEDVYVFENQNFVEFTSNNKTSDSIEAYDVILIIINPIDDR